MPDDFEGLDEALSDIYYGNFSVFQSLPGRLGHRPALPGDADPPAATSRPPARPSCRTSPATATARSTASSTSRTWRRTLPLHELRPGEDYLLGVFLVGAYQETLGDLHNLFGDTNVASVRMGDNGEIEYARELDGDSVEDVLSYVEYDPRETGDPVPGEGGARRA